MGDMRRRGARWTVVLSACAALCASSCDSGSEDTASSTGGAGGTGGAALSVALPQALDGALFANPAVYSQVPLHVATTGKPDSVEVEVGGDTITATDADEDGDFVAEVPLAALGEGEHAITVKAARGAEQPVSTTATLRLGKAGVQMTDVGAVGMSSTPRLHRRGAELWLTWRDRAESNAVIHLQRLDGAARPMGDAVTLLGPSVDALHARAALGKDGIGLLYQTLGNPYVTHFRAVGFDGKELVATIDLDPSGGFGLTGGDIDFDGSGWVFVYRTTDGSKQELRWARVEEGTGELTGPIVVATSGNDDPNGKFPGFVPVGVRALAGKSLVSFVRERWDAALAMAIPKSQLALVSQGGTVEWSEYAGKESDWTFHHEARVFRIGETLVPIWSANDLTSSDPNPPNLFFATRTDAQAALDPSRGAGTVVFDAPDDRGEPFLVAHPSGLGVLAWLDHRKYTLEPQVGGIELYVAPVSEELTAGTPTVFSHARFIAGTSELNGVAQGTNVILTWLDERHGQGILDPKPEVWIETAWY